MEKKCGEEFELITKNLDVLIDKTTESIKTLVTESLVYPNFSLYQKLYKERSGDQDNNKPSTSYNSMSSILQEEFRADSQHNFAEVLDDETTSGVLEAFDISSSNSLPTCTTTTNASSDSVAVQEDSSSTDTAIQMMKAGSESGSVRNNPSISEFFSTANIFVINEDEDGDDVDNDLDREADDDEIELENDENGEGGNSGVGDDDTGDGIDNGVKSRVKQTLSNDDLITIKPMTNKQKLLNISKMSISANSHITESINDVIMATNAKIIYLETPVGEEQQQHDRIKLEATSSTNSIITDDIEKKTKRLNEQLLKKGQIDKEPMSLSSSSSSSSYSSSSSSSILSSSSSLSSTSKSKTSNNLCKSNAKVICNDIKNNLYNIEDSVPEHQICTIASQSHEHMSTHLKNMNLNNLPQEFSSNLKVLPMLTAEDIESMDLIERQDYEREERLTGGVILKTSSIIDNDVLNLSLLKSNHIDNQQDNLRSSISNVRSYQDNEINDNSHPPFAVDDLNVLYPCKDPPSTPASSRTYNSRPTKCTAKINMSTTLSQNCSEDLSENQQQQNRTLTANNKPQRAGTNHSNLSSPAKSKLLPNTLSVIPSASMCPSSSTKPNATSTVSIETLDVPTTSTVQTINTDNSNSNSNDSFMGSSSSTFSLNSNSSKIVSNDDLDSTYVARSPPSAPIKCNKSVSEQDHGSIVNTSTVVMHIFQNGCSRTNPVQPLMGSSGICNAANSANQLQEDDVQPSTSSARCPYASMITKYPQRYLHHASAQTNGSYLARTNTPTLGGVTTATASPLGKNVTYATRGRNRRYELALRQQQLRSNAATLFRNDLPAIEHLRRHLNFSENLSPWEENEENNAENEEICTCQSTNGNTIAGSLNNLHDTTDTDCQNLSNKDNNDLSNYNKTNRSISEESSSSFSGLESANTRKRKHHRLMNQECNSATFSNNNTSGQLDNNMRKRYAYDMASTSRSTSSNNGTFIQESAMSTPQVHLTTNNTVKQPTVARRSQRSLKNNPDNSSSDLQQWIAQFKNWTNSERLTAVDRLIEHCEPTQVRHMMKVIEPQLQRDFISLLPRELALQVLSNLDPKDLLRAAQTCRSWRFLCDDNLLWKEKCREAQIFTEPRGDRPRRGRAGNMPPIASPWKAAYIRQHIIELNWRSRPIRDPKVLKGHDEHVITCLQFSGNRIVSGSDDNTLKVWSAVTGRCLRTLVGHTGGVWSSQLSGNIIISGSTDRTLKVWDMETGHCVHTLLGHTSTVRCMHLHGKKVVSGSRDATLRVWNIEQGTCLRVLVGHLAAVRCVQYDGKLIVSGAYDYMVKVWHPDRSECLHTLQGHTNRVYSLQFDGSYVVSGSLDTSIRVWDVENGNCKHTLMGHQSLTSGMELRENILVSGNADSTVKVWDITTGQCLQTLSGPNKHQSAVTCLQFNSRFVVTSSDDGTVKLWDVKTGEFIRNLVTLESGGSGGVVWRIRTNDTKLICAVGSRNGTEETKLMVLDFDVEGACVKCS